MVFAEKLWLPLWLGLALGFLLGWMLHDKEESSPPYCPLRATTNAYPGWLRHMNASRVPVNPEDLSPHSVFYMESTFLSEKVPLICVVVVERLANAYSVANTWGPRCNTLLFYGTTSNQYLPVVKVSETSSWHFLCNLIRQLYAKHPHLHWVLFARDSNIVIPENARYLLAPKDHTQPHYIGHKSIFWTQLYNSGDTAYILSRGAVQKLLTRFSSSASCSEVSKYKKNEHYLLGKFLSELGVEAEDGRDEEGRERFHLFTPAQLVEPGPSQIFEKYSKKSVFPVVQGLSCCSPSSISFRCPNGNSMYFFNYLLYHVKLVSSGLRANLLSNKYIHSDEVWQKFIKEELGDINMSHVTNQMYYDLWQVKANTPEKFNQRIAQAMKELSHD